MNKRIIATAVCAVCIASILLSNQAYAAPQGYTDKQKVNISADFVFQYDLWGIKDYNAANALEQLTSEHESYHKITGCFNGKVCIHSLIVS